MGERVERGLTIIIDTREQMPWSFAHPTVRRKLEAGDYSITGLESRLAIERKALGDFVSTLTTGRERFERELAILAAYDRAAIIVEGDLAQIVEGTYRSDVRPQSLIGSIGSFFARYGVPTLFAGSRRNAEIVAEAMLRKCAKHLAIAEVAA